MVDPIKGSTEVSLPNPSVWDIKSASQAGLWKTLGFLILPSPPRFFNKIQVLLKKNLKKTGKIVLFNFALFYY